MALPPHHKELQRVSNSNSSSPACTSMLSGGRSSIWLRSSGTTNASTKLSWGAVQDNQQQQPLPTPPPSQPEQQQPTLPQEHHGEQQQQQQGAGPHLPGSSAATHHANRTPRRTESVDKAFAAATAVRDKGGCDQSCHGWLCCRTWPIPPWRALIVACTCRRNTATYTCLVLGACIACVHA